MAVQELVTRKFEGHSEDGSARYARTWTGQPRPPESVAEWAEQRVAALGGAASLPAGRVAVQLLQADSDAARKAALAAGRDLGDWERWGVLQVLEMWRKKAQEYGPAAGLARELHRAWTAKYGDKVPRTRRSA